MPNSLAQQWYKWEKPAAPASTGYATRLAAGPGPTNFPGPSGTERFQNDFVKANGAPPSNYPNNSGTFNAPLSTVAPVGVTMGTGWLYNTAQNRIEINTTPGAQTDCVITLDQGAPALTLAERIQVWVQGFMQAGTLTILQGGAALAPAANYSAAQFNAAAAAMPGIGLVRNLTPAGGTANTITLRFPAGALAQAQIVAVGLFRGYAVWPDYRVAQAGQMNP